MLDPFFNRRQHDNEGHDNQTEKQVYVEWRCERISCGKISFLTNISNLAI